MFKQIERMIPTVNVIAAIMILTLNELHFATLMIFISSAKCPTNCKVKSGIVHNRKFNSFIIPALYIEL